MWAPVTALCLKYTQPITSRGGARTSGTFLYVAWGSNQNPGDRTRRLDRRRLLGLAAVVGSSGLLAGCVVSDPAISGGPGTPPQIPIPTPALDGALTAYGLELALAGQLGALLALPGLPAGQRSRLQLVQAGHQRHAIAMAGPDPTDRSTTQPTPAPSGGDTTLPGLGSDPARALTMLTQQEGGAARFYRRCALASLGPTALLWGSLSAAAQQAGAAIAQTSPVTTSPARAPAPLPTVSDTEAAQQLLAQLHAVVWGYRRSMSALPRTGAAFARAASSLAQRMGLRDQITALLSQRGASVPAAKPAYRMPADPNTEAHVANALMTMEQALLPYAGQWLGSAATAQVTPALTALSDSGLAAVGWGAPPSTWPGWPD